jgi:hypothetical protein
MRKSGKTAGTEITVFTKTGGPLTKKITLGKSGKVVSDGSACKMSEGKAQRVGSTASRISPR